MASYTIIIAEEQRLLLVEALNKVHTEPQCADGVCGNSTCGPCLRNALQNLPADEAESPRVAHMLCL